MAPQYPAMRDREPEPWETDAPGPFLTIEAAEGVVELWAFGEDRFTVKAPGHAQLVVGFDEAERLRTRSHAS
jgi:hypothetical protein